MTYESFKMLAWYRDRGSNADMRQQCESLLNQEILRVLRALQEAEARRASIRSGVTFEERPSMPPPFPFSAPDIQMDASLRRRSIDELAELMRTNSGISTTDTSATPGTPGYHYASTSLATSSATSSAASPSISSSVGTC